MILFSFTLDPKRRLHMYWHSLCRFTEACEHIYQASQHYIICMIFYRNLLIIIPFRMKAIWYEVYWGYEMAPSWWQLNCSRLVLFSVNIATGKNLCLCVQTLAPPKHPQEIYVFGREGIGWDKRNNYHTLSQCIFIVLITDLRGKNHPICNEQAVMLLHYHYIQKI